MTFTDTGKLILQNGGDITQWGLANAVTAQAHTEADLDRSFEFEKIGSRILELPAAMFDLN